jgi:hypothetical protein
MPPIIERPDAVDRDPLLGELHRRHPDVDILVLPPQRVPVPLPPPASLDEAVDLAERCRAAIEGATAGLRTGPVPALWWRQGLDGSHRHVTRTSALELDDPMGVLADLAQRLGDDGWRVRRLLDPRPRVEADRGPVRLRADAFPSAVQVEVVSVPLVLDEALLRALRARARRAAR